MDFISLVPVLLPIALFVVTMIIVFTLRAGDKSNRSIATVKKLLDKYKGDVEASDSSFKQYAAELEQTISKKDSEVKELIQTVNSQLGELRSYSEDLVRLKMAMDTYREALEGLARLTSDADDKIANVQSEVDRLDKVRNVIDGFRQDMRDADEHLRKHEQRVIQLERESIGRMNTAVSETDSSMDEAMAGLHKESMEIFDQFKEKTDKDTELRLRRIDDSFQAVIHTVQEFFGELENKLDAVKQESCVLDELLARGSQMVSGVASSVQAPSVPTSPAVSSGTTFATSSATTSAASTSTAPKSFDPKPGSSKSVEAKANAAATPSAEAKANAEAKSNAAAKPGDFERKADSAKSPSTSSGISVGMDIMDIDYGYGLDSNGSYDAHGVSNDSGSFPPHDDATSDDYIPAYGGPQWETYGEEEVVDFDDDADDAPYGDKT